MNTEIQEEISLKELLIKSKIWFNYLLSKWIILLIAGILGGSIGLGYAFIKKPIYTAETTFVLEEGETGGGLGQYNGLASIVGIDLGGGGGGIFQGDNIIQLYLSRKMIEKTLFTLDTFDNTKKELLIDRYIKFNKLRESWNSKPNLKNIVFKPQYSGYSRLQDSITSKIVEDIQRNFLTVSKPDKKLSIISVKIKCLDELFAKSFTDNIVKMVNEFYINTKTQKSAENLYILQHQADSIKTALNYNLSGVANAIDANPNLNPAFQTLRVPSEKKQVDVRINAAAYEEIVRNLELAKISFRKSKPLIQVIDQPIFPLKVEKSAKSISTILGGILFGLLTAAFLLIKKYL